MEPLKTHNASRIRKSYPHATSVRIRNLSFTLE